MIEMPIVTEFYADSIATETKKKMQTRLCSEGGIVEESGEYIYAITFPYFKVGEEEVRGKRKFKVTVEEVVSE